jgi:VanZ family protein
MNLLGLLAAIPRKIWLAMFGISVTAVTVLSLLPKVPIPNHGIDKIEHFVAYLAVGASGSLATAAPIKRVHLLLVLIALACCLELLQYFIPGRTPGIRDALASILGAAAGITAGQILQRRMNRSVSLHGSV